MVVFVFILILIENSVANSGDPDQTLHSAASGLGLHCLPMSYRKDARLKWVNIIMLSIYTTLSTILTVDPRSTAPLFAYVPQKRR